MTRDEIRRTVDDFARAAQHSLDAGFDVVEIHGAHGYLLKSATTQALATINDAGVTTEGQRGYHLLFYAAQIGRTCIGPTIDGDQTFVNLDDWAPDQVAFARPDALAELVSVQRQSSLQTQRVPRAQARGGKGKVIVEDKGPGISDLAAAMKDHVSTGGTLGLGLPGAKRLVDEFEIVSRPGHGTRVRIVKWR